MASSERSHSVRGRKRSPYFFKVFLPQLSAQHLTIPPNFRKHFVVGGLPNTVSLKGPSGNIWIVHLVNAADGELFFGGVGWKAFVADHSLAAGDFLLFRYDWRLRFTVLVFDKTACEKDSSFTAVPSLVNIKMEVGGECALASSAALLGNGRGGGKRKRWSEVMPKGPLPKRGRPFAKDVTARKSNLNPAKSNPHSQAPVMHLKASSSAKQVGTMLLRSSSQKLKPASITSKARATEVPKNAHLATCSKIPLVKEVAVKKEHCGRFTSQRRPVTQEEMHKALEKAKLFKPNCPSFMMQMRDSHVYFGFFLSFPSYVKKLPSAMFMTLLNPKGKEWQVRYLRCEARHGLSGGWHKFSSDNNLESGDVCVFELISKSRIKVHIFRVVE